MAKPKEKAWAVVTSEGGIPDGVQLRKTKAEAEELARSEGNYEGDAEFEATSRGTESRVFEVTLP